MLRFLVRVLAAGLAIAVAAIPEANAQEARGARTADNVVNVAGEPEGFPFSPAIKAGGMIYLSGQVGNLAQTRQAMENIRTVLEAAGATLYDVVKCTVFLDDMEDYWPMNEVYASFWDGPPPARSAFGADGLALGALLEIECIARDPVIE
jgi:reactive intermediate/imine deaminase